MTRAARAVMYRAMEMGVRAACRRGVAGSRGRVPVTPGWVWFLTTRSPMEGTAVAIAGEELLESGWAALVAPVSPYMYDDDDEDEDEDFDGEEFDDDDAAGGGESEEDDDFLEDDDEEVDDGEDLDAGDDDDDDDEDF